MPQTDPRATTRAAISLLTSLLAYDPEKGPAAELLPVETLMVLVDELGGDDETQGLIFLAFGHGEPVPALLAKLEELTGLAAEWHLRQAAVKFH